MAVLSMSKQEFSRLDMLLRVHSGRLRVTDACELIGLQRRRVFRLLRGLKQDGATSLLSKRRGRPSNHRPPAEVRALTLSIVRERYSEFGPSLAKEKLAEHHGCSVSRETMTAPEFCTGRTPAIGLRPCQYIGPKSAGIRRGLPHHFRKQAYCTASLSRPIFG
jgi:hypothetical protein